MTRHPEFYLPLRDQVHLPHLLDPTKPHLIARQMETKKRWKVMLWISLPLLIIPATLLLPKSARHQTQIIQSKPLALESEPLSGIDAWLSP